MSTLARATKTTVGKNGNTRIVKVRLQSTGQIQELLVTGGVRWELDGWMRSLDVEKFYRIMAKRGFVRD
jgi:hypothetical protein